MICRIVDIEGEICFFCIHDNLEGGLKMMLWKKARSESTPTQQESVRFGLRSKLVISLVGLVALSSVLMIMTMTRRSAAFLDEQARQDIDRNLTAFELLLEAEMDKLHGVSEVLLNFPGLVEMVAVRDGESIRAFMDETFEVLRNDVDIVHLQVSDRDRRVLYRGQEPGVFGSDLSSDPLVQLVWQTGVDAEGFSMADEGIYLLSGEPLYDDSGTMVGVLEVGKIIDNNYLDSLKEQLDVNFTLFSGDQRVATTIQNARGERAVGTRIDHAEILADVLQEGGRWVGRLFVVGSNDIYGAYAAIHGFDGAVIGMLFAGESAEIYDARRRQDVLTAVLLLVICMAVSTALALFLSGKIVGPVIALSGTFKQVAAGDFTVSVPDYGQDEIGVIGRAVKGMVSDLQSVFGSIVSSAQAVEQLSTNVSDASENITVSIQDVASSVNEVAASTAELSSSSQDMTHESMAVADKAGVGTREMDQALEQMKTIESSFRELKVIIRQLGERSRSIGDIIKVINDISEQTNLLALNAAIEAARAGEYGRGFAVVADEVRKLAEQSSASTKEIERLIFETQADASNAVNGMERSTASVEEGIEVMAKSSQTFAEIVNSIQTLLSRIENVASSSQELSASSQEVAASTEEQSASIQEISAAAEELKDAATTLYQELQRFKF